MEWSWVNCQLARESTEIVKHQPSTYALPVRATDQRSTCSTRRSADIRGLHDEIAGRPRHDVHSSVPRHAAVRQGNAHQMKGPA